MAAVGGGRVVTRALNLKSMQWRHILAKYIHLTRNKHPLFAWQGDLWVVVVFSFGVPFINMV